MKKELPILFSFIVLLAGGVHAQTLREDQAFETKIINIYTNLSSSATHENFKKADSLYQSAVNSRQKAEVLLLKADLFGKEGKPLEAIRYSDWALRLAREMKDYGVEVMAYQNMVRFYAAHGFYQQSEAALEKGLQQVARIKEKRRYVFYRSQILKAAGELAMAKEEYDKAEDNFQAALRDLRRMDTRARRRNKVVFDIYNLLGQLYSRSNQPEKALEAYYEGQRIIGNVKCSQTVYAGQIYNGLARVYLDQLEVDSTVYYLNRATAIARSGRVVGLQFKEEVSMRWLEYYRMIQQHDSVERYRKQFSDLSRRRGVEGREAVNAMMAYLLRDVKENKKENQQQETGIWWFFGGVLLLGSSGFLLYRRHKTKLILLSVIEEWGYMEAKISPIEESKDNRETPTVVLSHAVIQELKVQLKSFEEENGFLDDTLSFPKMAATLNTNTKYLNVFFGSFLNTNYHTYINKKRIGFIVEKLQTDRKWRTYKLTYLAEEAGFSSYSAFANSFKRYTGCSPSIYGRKLRTTEKGKNTKGKDRPPQEDDTAMMKNTS